MKKGIIILFLVSLGIIFMNQDEEIIIPNDAIRFRVIANSNSVEDQEEKTIIKDKIGQEVKILIDTAYNDAQTLLKEHRDKLDAIANVLLEKEKINEQEFNSIFEERD